MSKTLKPDITGKNHFRDATKKAYNPDMKGKATTANLANELIELWNDYRHSKKGREAQVPTGFPVFNATNFIYWLVDKYER